MAEAAEELSTGPRQGAQLKPPPAVGSGDTHRLGASASNRSSGAALVGFCSGLGFLKSSLVFRIILVLNPTLFD